MTIQRTAIAAVAALLATGAASAADQGLLNLVMPEAKVVIGLQVDQAKLSPFGQYLLSQAQPGDPGFQKLLGETGFDPRKNVSEILIASNGPQQSGSKGLVLARGSFNVAKIESAAQFHGGTVTTFSGVDVITRPGEKDAKALAFPDGSTAIAGDVASVQGAITRLRGGAGLTEQMQATVQTASAGSDFWFVTLAPLSEFSASIPDQGVGNAMKGSNLFQTVQQASAGIKFGDPVKISGQALTASAKDAQALVDAIRFLTGLVTMNRQKDPAAGMIASLVDLVQLQANDSTMTFSMSIPEKQLESLVASVRAHHDAPAAGNPSQP